MNILSATLTGIGALLELIMIFFVKDLEIYGDPSNDRVVEMQVLSRTDAAPGKTNSNNSLNMCAFYCRYELKDLN